MPEEDLETAELKEQIDQRLEDHEHHEHHGHGKPEQAPSWLRYLSLSTAMIAVFAAVASLESGSNSNEAILEKSKAMLYQSQASDQWAFFQAKGIKATVGQDIHDLWASLEARSTPASTDGDAAGAGGGKAGEISGKLAKLADDSKHQREDAEKIKKDAEELDAKVKESDRECDALMATHHRFAIAVTLLQIAIALSAIAALTRRKPLWFLSMAVSAGGLGMFLHGFGFL